ncbi:MAG TPA: FAD-dependent oxidoreductase [Deferrisomatales bacterium]|nr:FAD-dependent oxidoreductase [Deferrisomatales bacterium]
MTRTETVGTVIVGAGLSGLYAAFRLAEQGASFVVLEARERLGGRIYCPQYQGFFADLGPSWFWPDVQPRIANLTHQLGLAAYHQYATGRARHQLPGGEVRETRGFPMEPPSWRLRGGMRALAEALEKRIPAAAIQRNRPVCRIEQSSSGARVVVGEREGAPGACYETRRVILALPPRLAAVAIAFTPELPPELSQGMLEIGTWMAGQAKFCALYHEPFWRRQGLSGQAFSQCGPMAEIHDGSNAEGGPYGLVGFVGIPAAGRGEPDPLVAAILFQLGQLFGEPARSPVAWFYRDWARETYTATPRDQAPMREHPRYHPPAERPDFWNGAVLFAGTETAEQHGGYLEGALAAAERALLQSSG